MCSGPHGEYLGCYAPEFCPDEGGVTCSTCLAGESCAGADYINLELAVLDMWDGFTWVEETSIYGVRTMLEPVGIPLVDQVYDPSIDFHGEAVNYKEYRDAS